MPTEILSNSSNSLFDATFDPYLLFSIGRPITVSNVFEVKRPVSITLWTPDGIGLDSVRFERVLQDDKTLTSETCCGYKQTGGVVDIAAIPYKICTCEPQLSVEVNRIVIDSAGKYRAVLPDFSAAIGNILVIVAPEFTQNITNEMRGCCAEG